MIYILCTYSQSKAPSIHELFHAVGSLHQQSTPDRDNYVNISSENIIPGGEDYLKIHEDALTFGSTYAYRSVMHSHPNVSISMYS